METQEITQVDGYDIVRRDRPTMYFVGVTTGSSSIMRLFPVWAGILGLGEAQLIGVDCPLHADPQQYRQAVAQIKYDPLSLGALVTTHKLDLLEAALPMFDELDRYAVLCKEVSNIAKRDGRLVGFAKDPITAGRTLQEMLEPGYWGRTGAHVLCLGAGGTTAAIAAYFLTRPERSDRPDRFIAVNRNRRGLDNLRQVVEQIDSDVDVEYVLNEDPRRNDSLMESLPPGSLVVNATGMGKDRPGSPVTGQGKFPQQGVIWELNYRGELDFLHQAQAQENSGHLRIYDGWRYFVHAWAEHVAEVFHLQLTPDTFARLAAAANAIRN
jgi:shikimate dehydrogenase